MDIEKIYKEETEMFRELMQNTNSSISNKLIEYENRIGGYLDLIQELIYRISTDDGYVAENFESNSLSTDEKLKLKNCIHKLECDIPHDLDYLLDMILANTISYLKEYITE